MWCELTEEGEREKERESLGSKSCLPIFVVAASGKVVFGEHEVEQKEGVWCGTAGIGSCIHRQRNLLAQP